MPNPKLTKIIFCDDEPAIQKLMLTRLGAQRFQVLLAKSGADAVEKAKTEKPEVIVLDQMMPDMTGIEACKCLKADPRTKAIPVVMFTCYTKMGFENDCIAAGAVGVIYKPHIVELAELIRRILSGEKIEWGSDDE